MEETDVIIVGGGLAGLACGVKLAQRGIDFQILEASDRVGGRVRTDCVDGYRMDHGFQVLLTAYPAAQELLDYEQLDLRAFAPGAMVRQGDGFQSLDDPWRSPSRLLATATSGIGTVADKLRIGLLRYNVCKGDLEDLWNRVQQPTHNRLAGLGFSDDFVDHFLRPWMGGVFLDRQLNSSSRILEFVFRMFSQGDAAVPAKGMQEIPNQLASRLPADRVALQATVTDLQGTSVQLSSGKKIQAKEIVVATEASAASRLLGWDQTIPWQQVTCFYFACDEPPVGKKTLVLPGDSSGPVNNFCEISSVSTDYAPQGKHLLSISVLDKHEDTDKLASEVIAQMREWFGDRVDTWQRLRTYRIPYALPAQTIDRMQPVIKPVDQADGPIVCGDHRETASIQGALNSGMRAADAVCGRLG